MQALESDSSFVERRYDDLNNRGNSPVYRGFEGLHSSGMELRAIQCAQQILPHVIPVLRRCLLSLSAFNDVLSEHLRDTLERALNAYLVRIGTQFSGNIFRDGDHLSAENNEFRRMVISHAVTLFMDLSSCFEVVGEGLPGSVLEEKVTNGIVEGINCRVGERVLAIEAKTPRRFRRERFEEWLVGKFIAWKGFHGKAENDFDSDPEAEEIARELDSAGVDHKTLGGLVRVCGKFLFDGTDELLDQFAREENLKEGGDIEATTLERSHLLSRLLRGRAERFIAADRIEDVFDNDSVQELLAHGIEVTVAHEVESTFDLEVAAQNLRSFQECIRSLGAQPETREGKPQKKFMSMKLTSLALSTANPDDAKTLPEFRKEEVKNDLRNLLALAMEHNVFIRIDMEQFIYKDVTFEIFTELLSENPCYADYLGMVFQTYLKDSPQDAREMIQWAASFHAKNPEKKVSLRLVKGANKKKDERHAVQGLHTLLVDRTWHEKSRTALSASGEDCWDPEVSPISKDLETTQRQFIEIMKAFEQHRDCLDLCYGTHNRDTIAHLIQTWMNNGSIPFQQQVQSLLGMYNSQRLALADFVDQRAYVPYGLLGKILAYMARRFEEYQKVQAQGGMPVMRYDNGLKKVA